MFVVFSLMVVGVLPGELKSMTMTKRKFVSRYTVNIVVLLGTTIGIQRNLRHSDILETGQLLLISPITILICPVVSILVAEILRSPGQRNGVFVALTFLSNTLFIGLPVTRELFGNVSLPYVMIYCTCSMVSTRTITLMLVERSGETAE